MVGPTDGHVVKNRWSRGGSNDDLRPCTLKDKNVESVLRNIFDSIDLIWFDSIYHAIFL